MATAEPTLDELAGPDGGAKGQKQAKHWLDQIEAIDDHAMYKNWYQRGQKISERYRDDRSAASKGRRYNALWSNIEILQPALYGRCPLPVAERKFRDRDPVGRAASQILERGLRTGVEISGLDNAIKRAVRDYLLPGRGTLWVRYEPEFEDGASLAPDTHSALPDEKADAAVEVEDNTTVTFTATGKPRPHLDPLASSLPAQEIGSGEEATSDVEAEDTELEETEKLNSTNSRVIRESTPVDYIHWRDFYAIPANARTWAEVAAVAKRVYMSREQLIARFGTKIGKAVPLDKDDRQKAQANSIADSALDKAQVYEIWCKDDRCVYWVAKGYDHLLDRRDDPLEIDGFFPCPEPLFANATNDTLVPVPDYIQYQDQAAQIDELTQRIAMLTKACKMAGVYNAAAKDVQRLFQEGVENQLIPVDDWAAFAGDKGGVAGNISLLPVKDVIGILNELMIVKAKQIEEMDRLTGITDIMRGVTDARETLGGQRLKSNSSGTRLTSRQNDIARFARDTVRIIADIMCKHFSPQSLIEISGALYEEGLGPDELPGLAAFSQDMASAAQPAPPMGGALPGPMGAGQLPGRPVGLPGAAPGMPQPGSNVVPFARPGLPGAPQPPMQPMEQPENPIMKALERIIGAIKLLRNERLRGFRVDIEVDSTIYPDQAQDRDDRNQFIASVTGFIEKSMVLGMQMPESIPLLGKLLQFGVRGYRIGRDLEVAIEDFIEDAAKAAKKRMAEAKNQQNPEQMKAHADLIAAQAKAEAAKASTQGAMIKVAADKQLADTHARTEQMKAEGEIERQRLENEGERSNAQIEQQTSAIDLQIRLEELQVERARLAHEREQMIHERAKWEREARVGQAKASQQIAQAAGGEDDSDGGFAATGTGE